MSLPQTTINAAGMQRGCAGDIADSDMVSDIVSSFNGEASAEIAFGTGVVYDAGDAQLVLNPSGSGDKVKGVVAVPSEHGVATHWDLRAYVNAVFITRANKVLPVKHIYFAGDPVPNPKVEFYLRRRLLSYHEMSTGGKKKYSCLAKHLELIGGG
jgi:hypothetical protein